MLAIEFERNNLKILTNGQRKVIDLTTVSIKLLEASEAQRRLYKITPFGN